MVTPSQVTLTNAIDGVAVNSEVFDRIICADVIEGMKMIPDESVSLVWTSPPYNTSIKYGAHDDEMPWPVYLDWLQNVWKESARVLRPGGRLAINIDAITNWDEDRNVEYVRPIYAELVNMMRKIDGMNFRTEIMWCKHQVVGRATAWGSYTSCSNPVVRRNHEYILVWSKGQWMLPGDPEQSDMTDVEFQQWTMSTWNDIVPETRKLGGHPVPFPEKLAYRVIKLFSYRGDVVLDPFSGSGTTCKVAADLRRRYIGIDIDPNYCKFASSRVAEAKAAAELNEQINPYVPRSKRPKLRKEEKEKGDKPAEPDVFG